MSWVSRNLPTNEAKVIHVECKQTKNQWGHETQISPIVRCGLHALEVANLNVVASNRLRICFKSQSLPNSIIVILDRHQYVPDPLQSAQIHENATKICLNRQQTSKAQSTRSSLDHKKITYLSVETNKLPQRAYPSTELNQFSIQQHLHIPAAVNTKGNLIKFS